MKKTTHKRLIPQMTGLLIAMFLVASALPSFASETNNNGGMGVLASEATIAITPFAEYGYPDSNPDGWYLSDVLGISRYEYIRHLTDNQSCYLETPYVGGAMAYYAWESGPWWPQGYPSPTGYVGMNCAGFVAASFYNAGADTNSGSFMDAWYYSSYDVGRWSNAWIFGFLCYPSYYNLCYYDFPSYTAMMDSGLLEKGDIPLEESLAYFAEGTELVKLCRVMLTNAEQTVRLLAKDDAGEAVLLDFDANE